VTFRPNGQYLLRDNGCIHANGRWSVAADGRVLLESDGTTVVSRCLNPTHLDKNRDRRLTLAVFDGDTVTFPEVTFEEHSLKLAPAGGQAASSN